MYGPRIIVSTQAQSKDWRSVVKELKSAADELNQYQEVMTPYERSVITRSIAAKQEEAGSRVISSALTEWKAQLGVYQDKDKALNRAKTEEIRRWDSQKLAVEISAIQSLVDLAISTQSQNPMAGKHGEISSRLKMIYHDAKESGNLHRQRAAAEVFKGLRNAKVPKDDMPNLGVMAQQAEKDLLDIRVTDEMIDTLEERDAAVRAVLALKGELAEASKALGQGEVNELFGSGPFTKALKMAQLEPDNSLTILDENDPKVTGIFWKEGNQDA